MGYSLIHIYDDTIENIVHNTIAEEIRAMLNNVDNNSNELALNSRLIRQDSLNSVLGTNMQRRPNNVVDNSNFLIDSSDISSRAIQMYERELDIKNFTQLATSNPENTNHNEMVEELFSKGIVDVFEDSTIAALSTNKSLLDDLGL